MADIQVDMFEIRLAAGVLTQFSHLESNGVPFQLLVTSQPNAVKVHSYRHPATPPVAANSVGDVRLTFAGKTWKIGPHAIHI